jgi:hypothetical protein
MPESTLQLVQEQAEASKAEAEMNKKKQGNHKDNSKL